MRETSASGFFFDFVETVLAIALGSFVLFYFVLGDRFFLAQQVVKTVMPVSIFLLMFIIKSKVNRRKIKKLQKEDKYDEIYVDLSLQDKRMDMGIIFVSSFFIIILPMLIDRIIYTEDIMQSSSFLLLLFLWHSYIFRKREHSESMYLNKNDKARDEMFVYIIPVVCMLAPVMNINVDIIDIIQAIIGFGMIYIWRMYMYRHAINR